MGRAPFAFVVSVCRQFDIITTCINRFTNRRILSLLTHTYIDSSETLIPHPRSVPLYKHHSHIPSSPIPHSQSFNFPPTFATYAMSVPPEYVHAKMQAASSRAHNAALSKSGKKYYTPSRNANDPWPPMMGTPTSVPAEYVLARMQAEKNTAASSSITPPRTTDLSSPASLGTPMAVPAEYVWAKEQEKKSRRPSVTSGASDLRYSEETAYSYDKDYEPVDVEKRSLGRKLKGYLRH